MIVKCPICETNIELKDSTKERTRFSCPVCFAQLALSRSNGKSRAICALCKKPNPECSSCDEREQTRVEKDLIS